MLKAENISKSFGAQILFDTVSFNINLGERVGLVARNGHGKTTLLRLLLGAEAPDSGQVVVPKGYQLGYVKQHLDFTKETVLEEGCLGLSEYHKNDSWRVEKILTGLGFSREDMSKSPEDFSGGYQVRLNLAKVLVSDPNLLLLDEPTNFLDVVSIRWLASFLNQWRGELLLVTHDQSFMDRVITHTLGIHRQNIQKMTGTTATYYRQLAQSEEVHEKTRVNEEKKRKETELFISRFRAKARLAGMVQSRVKALEKQGQSQRLEKIRGLDFSFNYEPSPARIPLQVQQLSFSYDPEKLLIGNLNVAVGKNDRIGVIGPNGSGKTTLLRLMAGELAPATGECLSHNATKIGYYAQTNRIDLNELLTVEQEVMNTGCLRQRARDICGTMMFEGDQALKLIKALSGGEKSRVLLAKILVSPTNLLLLDEPSNHLDMDSCQAFLEAVERFEGAVVLVTHNEQFLHTLANRLIVFQSNSVTLFEGSYSDFLEKVGWENEIASGDSGPAASASSAEPDNVSVVSKKELRKLRADIISQRSRQIAPLEKRITQVETALEEKEAAAEKLNSDLVAASEAMQGDRIAELSKDYHEVQAAVETLYDELDTLFTEIEEQKQSYDDQLSELEK